MLTRTCCAAMAISLLLVSCGGGGGGNGNRGANSGSSASAGFEVLDAGAEPRISLSTGASRQALLSIEVEATESIDLNGAVQDDQVSASLELVSDLAGNDDGGVDLRLTPVLASYSELTDVDGVVVPGAWQRRYDANGVLVDAQTNDQSGITGLQSLDVFVIPALILPVPDAPVGAGASWRSESVVDAGRIRSTTRLMQVQDAGLQVETTSEFIPQDDTVMASRNTVVTAAYDRESLLIRSGEVQSTATFSGTVNRNGNETSVRRTRTHRHTFTEVRP